MYLSRIRLDTNKEKTMYAISSPQILHAVIEDCFIEKNRTLWRLDSLDGGILYLLLVSEIMPRFDNLVSRLCAEDEYGQTKEYTAFLNRIKNGQKLQFRLRGNTVYSKASEHGVLGNHDRSLSLRKVNRGKVVPHVSEYHKKQWLINKAPRCGFLLNEQDFAMIETGQQRFNRKSEGKSVLVQLSHTTFEGVLTVTDTHSFIEALVGGIGKAKAYGCGLMTVMVI